jgi:hypothetical protein
MPSYFLAETCKYLYLLFDENNFVLKDNRYLFSTESHIFPVFPPNDNAEQLSLMCMIENRDFVDSNCHVKDKDPNYRYHSLP